MRESVGLQPDVAAAEPGVDTEQAARNRNQAKAAAMRLLGRREHAAAELITKLRQRQVDADLAADVVAELAAEGWQSDSRFAESCFRRRVSGGYGPMKIRAELREKRISTTVVDQLLAAYDDERWDQLASEQRQRKFGGMLPTAVSERARQQRHLLQRGFAHGHIRAAMSRSQ